MTTRRSRSGSFKIVATLGMVLLMAFISACDLLATEGARDAIANGREIRAFEDENLIPLETKMSDLWVTEIQPRESNLEDIRQQLQRFEEDVMRPLKEAQGDIWAPGGEASELQVVFDLRYREIELLERAIQLEQHELDTAWQDVWDGDKSTDPEHQALEDLRYEKQRELDRLYRFGYRPIDDIWDQINDLNSAQGLVNMDAQIEADRINTELQRLWDLISVMESGKNDEAKRLNNRWVEAQDQLNHMQNYGWNPIQDIYNEIEQLEFENASSSVDTNSINAQISELEILRTSYVANRDAEVAALNAQLEAIDAVGAGEGSDGAVIDNSARLAEIEQWIISLEAEVAGLLDVKLAEIDALNDEINEMQTDSEQAIADATADFQEASERLLADAAAIDEQIAAIAPGTDGAPEQIAELQFQKALLIAEEEASELALHDATAQLVTDREADVAELQASIDSIHALIDFGLTDEIYAQIADLNHESASLQAADDSTAITTSTTQTVADIRANIEASEAYWNGFIDEVSTKIIILDNELRMSSNDNQIDARIDNLQLQATELERALNSQIAELEVLVNELSRQANNTEYGSSEDMEKIQSQIDALNNELNEIWQQESKANLEIRLQIMALETQARALDEENEQIQRLLEEELWDMDEKLGLFYKDQESVRKVLQSELEAVGADIQQRRQGLEEQRWAIGEEQRTAFDAIELAQTEAYEQIKLIEEKEFGAVRGKMRELEAELRVFYDQQRELEVAIRAAQAMVEQKKRDLEDKLFEALESAAGTVDQAGDTVLTATETLPKIDEGDATPSSSSNE